VNTPTDWLTAIAILAAGVILGLLFVFFNKRKGTATLGGEPDLERKDLEAKRDALVQQLRDPGLSPDERQRLEVETATVLRQLDEHKPRATASGAPAASAGVASSTAMNPTVKGFLWGAGSFAALAALGYFVMQQATPRQEGGSLTGNLPTEQQPSQQQQAPDPMVLGLEAAVQKDPNNLQLRNELAQAYLERENLMGVFEQTKFVLEKSPNDSRALTFQGLVRMAMGEREEATKMMQRATESDPQNLDAWVSLAWVYAQSDRMGDAEKMIAEAKKQSPGDAARLDQVFGQMRQQVANPPQTAANELPPNHPPIDGAPTPAPATAPVPALAGSDRRVRVTLDLDAGVRQRNGVIFVIARNPAGGPPVAVKRIAAGAFPVTVELSSADSMMGQPLPDRFRLEARLDSDGDAMTKTPNDPTAMQNDVAPGSTVRLALK
jgi:tetratricopeptide (TPR) repeat protein